MPLHKIEEPPTAELRQTFLAKWKLMMCKLKAPRVGQFCFESRWRKSHQNEKEKELFNLTIPETDENNSATRNQCDKKPEFIVIRWTVKATIMQAALMIRSKQRIARNKLRRQRLGIKGELPTSVATKDIPVFPRFPPESWVGTDFIDTPKVFKGFSLKFFFISCLIYVNFSINQFTSVTPFSFPSQENFVSLMFRGGRAPVTSNVVFTVKAKHSSSRNLLPLVRVRLMPGIVGLTQNSFCK